MTTDAFYVTFSRDARWFEWSTLVLEKNLSGIREIVAVAPEQDRHLFDPIAKQRRSLRMVYIGDWPGMGYYWQQWVKMRADVFTNADRILHIDSDVFIREPISVDDFCIDGLPAWMWAYYSELGPEVPWREPTERAFGIPCEREFMQAQPLLVNRRLYSAARAEIEIRHDMGAREYIAEQGGKAKETGRPQFSEYNFLGAVAWAIQSGDYRWVDRNREPWPRAYQHCLQFWSHSKFEDNLQAIQQMLTGKNDNSAIRTTNRGIWVLANDTHISRWVEQQNRLDFDVPLLERICRHINPGDTVVDVGAFIGDHTLAYARATHGVDSGRVIAIEPNPTTFECLRRNMAGLSHVECHNIGLGDKPGEMGVAQSENAGASHLKSGKGVKIRTLDSFGLERCDFIKIDAEGMEVKILRGAEKTITSCRPTMFIEVNRGALERAGSSESELLSEIERHGYEISGRQDGPQYDVLCSHPQRKKQLKPIVCALGVCHRDAHLAEVWLKWVAYLSTLAGGDCSGFELLVMQTRRVGLEQHARLRNAIAETPSMFRTTWAVCPDEWEHGYPGSASHLFLRTLEWVEQNRPDHATMWCETDTVAMWPGWFGAIAREYTGCGMPFMGARVNPHDQHAHMTGNGVYPPNWRELAPSIARAYNAPGTEFLGRDKDQPWDVFAENEIEPKMADCRSIQQIWRPTVFSTLNLGLIRDDTALFHQCKDGSLTLAMTAARFPGFTSHLPAPDRGFMLETGARSLSINGLSFEFTPVARSAGGRLLCAYLPKNIEEQWMLESAVGKQGVSAIPVSEYHQLMSQRSAYRLD